MAFIPTDNTVDDDLGVPMLPLASAVRRQKKSAYGPIPELGDASVLPNARNASASVPSGPVDQARALPAAAAASQPQSGLAGLQAGYDARIGDYQKQLDTLNVDPDYSQLAQQQRNRGQQSVQSLAASIAAGMGPQDMQGMQKYMAQQSQQQLAPQKIEGGEIDASGNIMVDPGYKRQQQIAGLRTAIDTLEKQKTTAATAQERYDIQRQQNEAMMEFKRQAQADRAAYQQGILELKRDNAGGGAKMQAHGVTKDGTLVSYNPQDGQTYVPGPDGRPMPYNGPLLSQPAADKFTATAQHLQSAGDVLADVERQVRANPGSFSTVAAGSSMMPDFMRSRVLSTMLSEPERVARSLVMTQASQAIHDLSGAAVSPSEAARLLTSLPSEKDSTETILGKLRAAQVWQQAQLKALGGFGERARSITGTTAPPAAAPNDAPAPEATKTVGGKTYSKIDGQWYQQ